MRTDPTTPPSSPNIQLCEDIDRAAAAQDLGAFFRAVSALADEGEGAAQVHAAQLRESMLAGDAAESRELVDLVYDDCTVDGADLV